MPESISSMSTSAHSARVTPIVLRPLTNRRLVFLPEIVDNMHDAAAGLKGTFVYQVKTSADIWESVEAIDLKTLRGGDGVRLSLRACLSTL